MGKIKFIFIFFFIFLLFNFLTAFFANKYVPYLGFFPYGDLLTQYKIPSFISSFANFDGVHYISIATIGYGEFEQAFFPLYPLLISIISFISKINIIYIGITISCISFLIGLFFLYYFSKKTLKINQVVWLMFFLIFFPSSFFFMSFYTEGLFFMLSIGVLYFLQKEKYFIVAMLAFFASLTRIIGVFLIIPIFAYLVFDKKRENLKFQNLLILLSPILGTFLYSSYLWKTANDPLFFLTSQPKFGANRSTSIIFLPQVYYRYIKIFMTAQWNFQYFVSLLEFVFFTFAFIILALDFYKSVKSATSTKDYKNFSLNLFSFANLILPTLTGTFSSIPRYILFSFSFFIFLARIKNNFLKTIIAVIFIILHTVLLSFFIQGYFVS